MDKSKIIYHGQQQRYYLYNMLSQFCNEVFISCNTEQAEFISTDYKFIVDEKAYADVGPAVALLSAVSHFPERNWIVIGCDYPFISTKILEDFISTLKEKTIAAAFYNPPKKVYEPLLGYYSAGIIPQMINILEGEDYSLQHFLKIVNANKHVTDKEEIKNINTPDEMRAAKIILKSRENDSK